MNVRFFSRIQRWPRVGSVSRLPAHGLRATLDLVFPAACAACGREMERDRTHDLGSSLCESCLDQLELFSGPLCRRCGAPVPAVVEPQAHCIRCRGQRLWFDETVALGEYGGRLRELLLKMKQARGNVTSLALAELTWQRHAEQLEALEADVVVAVPMHWRRRWTHGTNSAAVLAEVFARRLRVRQRTRLLGRRRNTPPQFSLPPSKRWQNVRQAFSVKRGYPVQGAHVLLVDDIMTTGATCSEAARTLKAAGAGRVSVVVVARTLVH